MTKLNLGCGNCHMADYKNIDISPAAKADETYDVTGGIKENDNTMEAVFSGCMLEQIGDNDKFVFVLNEIWRVLKPGGIFSGYLPTDHENTRYIDPMDKRFFRPEQFDYFDGRKHHWQEFGRIYGFKPWEVMDIEVKDNGILHFKMTPQK